MNQWLIAHCTSIYLPNRKEWLEMRQGLWSFIAKSVLSCCNCYFAKTFIDRILCCFFYSNLLLFTSMRHRTHKVTYAMSAYMIDKISSYPIQSCVTVAMAKTYANILLFCMTHHIKEQGLHYRCWKRKVSQNHLLYLKLASQTKPKLARTVNTISCRGLFRSLLCKLYSKWAFLWCISRSQQPLCTPI